MNTPTTRPPAWYVTYRNEDRPEHTPVYPSKAYAVEIAAFLRRQGATHIRVREVGKPLGM